MNVFEKITAQQGVEGTEAWMVGEQLKEICRREPECADLIDKDLDNKAMRLSDAAMKIRAYADAQHKKSKASCVCVPPLVAEGILREFYGLPGRAEEAATDTPALAPVPAAESGFLNLDDFL